MPAVGMEDRSRLYWVSLGRARGDLLKVRSAGRIWLSVWEWLQPGSWSLAGPKHHAVTEGYSTYGAPLATQAARFCASRL